MILVIIGAGASYDSCASRRLSDWPRESLAERPPLAQELFGDSPIVRGALQRYAQCHPIVDRLRYMPEGLTLEGMMEMFKSQAENDPVRNIQLAAVRFYLQAVIADFETAWQKIHGGITNYVALLDQLRRARIQPDEPVCIVTFNYDCLVETALRSVGVHIKDINDYTADPNFKLFKLHGSVNWGRILQKPFHRVSGFSQADVMNQIITRANEVVTADDEFRVLNEYPVGYVDDVVYFPAIALRVEKKSASMFECPQAHLDCLKSYLQQTRKVLMIGWRGTEDHFTQLLWDGIGAGHRDPAFCAVAGSEALANETFKHSKANSARARLHPYNSGFSEFVNDQRIEKFCLS